MITVDPLDTRSLNERDAAFAHALYDAAVRRWITIDWLAGRFTKQPVTEFEPGVQAALVVGGAQLLCMGSVPAHAAIDEAVTWVKRNVRHGAGGLVNAVLRRVSESLGEPTNQPWTGQPDALPLDEGRSRPLVGIMLPDNPAKRAAAAFGLPLPLTRAIHSEHGTTPLLSLGEHSLEKPPAILSLMDRTEPPEGCVAHDEPGFAVWIGERGALASTLETERLWVQDPSSAGAINSIDDLQPERIIDLCAGMGTKTRQLAETFPDASILATDTDDARMRTLRQVFDRHDRVRVIEPSRIETEAGDGADLVLADVPCSNSGVLGRRVEARHRLTNQAVERLVAIQDEILGYAQGMLSERGAVLYATCSVDPRENEHQALAAAGRTGLSRKRERRVWPAGRDLTSRDGAYSVLLTGPGRLGWS